MKNKYINFTKFISSVFVIMTICSISMPLTVEAKTDKYETYKSCILCSKHSVGTDKQNEQAFKIAEKIVAKAPKQPHEAVKYFHDEILKRVKIFEGTNLDIHDPNFIIDQYSGDDAWRAFIKGTASPEGYANAFHMLCHMANIECYQIQGSTNLTDKVNTNWNIVKLEDGQWYEIDCFLDDNYGPKIFNNYAFFLKTRKQMKKTHYEANDVIGTKMSLTFDSKEPTAKGTKYAYDAEKGFYNLKSESGNKSGNNTSSSTTVKKGTKFTYKNITYKVLSKNTVQVISLTKAPSTTTIPATVTYKKTKFKVTSIAKNADKKSKTLKKVTIGANVTQIGASAFNGCSNAKMIIIKNAGSIKTVSTGAFKNVNKKAVFKIYAKDKSQYNKLVKKLKKSTNRTDVMYKFVQA